MSVDTAPLDAPAALGAEALEFPPPATAPSPRPDGLYGQRIPIGRRRLLAGRVAGCVAILAGLQYIAWRVSTVNGAVGIVFWAAEAINLLGLVATVALIWRAPGRSLRPVSGHRSLDVFVTVCGEPPEMVRETLVAALAIGLPHETYVLNDGRLAGKAGWEEIDRLAADMGVTCFTRVAGGVGKAANLNHAVALTNGDVIVTIDADHHAVPDLGQQLLGYFSDPRIAFVSTPQQYYGADDHALNNRELFFYRVIQPAKDASNSAFSCGNGVAYRRAALETVGGFSEWNVVEDVHTSYQLHAAGWHSAYHNHAVTTGVAPPTLAELARQRLRWATDSARLLFWDNPLRKRGLTVRQRLHYLHTAGFYLLAGTQLVFVISPALYLIGGVSIMRVDGVGELLWRSVPYYLALVAFFLAYCSPGETLRMVRQQLVLAPVYVLAVIRGLIGRPVRSGVTEKTKPASVSWVVLFTIGLMGLSLAALADAAISKRTGTVLAAAWAAWFCFALGGPVAAVSRSGAVQRAIRLALYLVILALLAVAVIPRPRPPAPAPAPPPAPAVPEPVTARLALAAPAHGVYLGVFNPAVVSTPGALTAWDRQHGTPARIVNSYQQWFSNDTRFHPDRARMIAAQGGVLMITWEPWAKPRSSVHATHQPAVRLRLIADGRYDGFVRRWARAAAAYRGPLLIRFMQEMNGEWYPWAYRFNGNTKREYVRAWRRVHDIFVKAGATNVKWVWAVNSFAGLKQPGRQIESYYPGRRYVDWVSVTGFNWGQADIPWRSPAQVFNGTLAALSRLHKPIMISEVGTFSDGSSSRPWIRSALRDIPRRYPRVHAIVWFDDRYDRFDDFRLRGRGGTDFDAAAAASPALHTPLRFSRLGS